MLFLVLLPISSRQIDESISIADFFLPNYLYESISHFALLDHDVRSRHEEEYRFVLPSLAFTNSLLPHASAA
jgi:hypothetical protein